MEDIRQNYSANSDNAALQEELKNVVEEMMRVEEDIVVLNEQLDSSEKQREELVSKLREQYLSSAATAEIVKCALEFFDESGEMIGFEDNVLQQIESNLENEVEDVVECIQEVVLKLQVNTCSYPPLVKRRWNLHILAVLLQLRRFDIISQELETSLNHVFNHLCEQNYEWRDLTSAEKDFLQEITENLKDVPKILKSLIKNLIAQLEPIMD